MSILTRIAIALTLLVSLTACATSDVVKPSPSAAYTFKHTDFDFNYAWNIRETGDGVLVQGLMKNVRYASVEDVEVHISLLDKDRKVIANGDTFLVPRVIKIDDYPDFQVPLKNAKISKGDLLQFMVNYTASEGQASLTWKSNFTVDALTGVKIGTSRNPDDEW